MNNFSMCSKCNEKIAVLFIGSTDPNESKPRGLCLKCASEMGIKPVDDMMEQMGISKEDAASMSDDMTQMMEGMDMEELKEALGNPSDMLQNLSDISQDKENPMAKFTENLMGMMGAKDEGEEVEVKEIKEEEKGKKPAKESRETRRERRNAKNKFLNNYAVDLTKKARDGKLDKIIGRSKEIDRALQILNRRSKNNPCLIGEPGVGKTAIAEGIALDIVNDRVPLRLREKEIHQLDLTALVAGTQFRGQFESRVKGLLEEVTNAGNIILFVDEVHNLVGAGESEGAMSAANIFKPALSRGEIQVIGATTFTEYRKYIEKDTALERRFQPITVEEPSIGDSIEVLEGIKFYYEEHHRVIISDAIIRSAVLLSERYIHDRFLPDKAIDLIDEAASSRSLASMELEEYDLASLEIEKLNEELEELELEEEMDFEQIANVRAKLLQAQEELEPLKAKTANVSVTSRDLAKVIALWTGIDANRIEESDFTKVADLERRLNKRVVGQKEACRLVANAVRRHQVQIAARRRPASFIFVGPTAVGKTELVKVLADELFDTPDPLIRLDMSEYMEQHSVSKIIGAPPGYIGYDEAGQLTEQVRRKPYSIILLDEIEKAHPNVLNIMLQILDEGKITDSHGRKISFDNTVIVMTSNAGSQFTDSALGFGKSKEELSQEKVMNSLKEFLRPEFISRIDEIVVFLPLTKDNFVDIADLMLSELKNPMQEQGIKFSFTKEVCLYLAEKSFGKKTGAREIRHVIRREIEDGIADLIIDHPEKFDSSISIKIVKDKLIIE